MKKKSIAAKYAEHTHMSKAKAMKDNFLFPFIISKKSQDILDLDNSELDYLKEKKQDILSRME